MAHPTPITERPDDVSRWRALHPRYWPLWALLGLLYLISLLPQRATWLLGVAFGELAFRLHRTPTIRTNIAMCFPDRTAAEQRALVRRYYRRAAQAAFDLGLAFLTPPERLKRRVRVVGAEHIQQAWDSGRGVILLAPHVIGLELGNQRLSLDWPMAYMYRRPRDPLINRLILRFRSRHGAIGIERYDTLSPLVRMLRKRTGLFYYLPDQDPDHVGKDYVFAPFFGVSTATYTALGRMARMGNAAVIPCFTRQLPCGRGYEVILKAPMEDFPTGDDLEDTRRMNEAIEQGVIEAPDQYFWSYRRFKTRPDNAPSPYLRKK